MEPRGRRHRQLTALADGAADLAGAAGLAGLGPRPVMAAVVAGVARRHGVERAELGPLGRGRVPAAAQRLVADAAVLDDMDGEGDADRLGALHQALVVADDRRRRGVHYTPRAAAEVLVALAWQEWESGRPRRSEPGIVLDPACGGGAFLLAAARTMHARGADPADVVARLAGIDVDALAVDVTVAAVALWARTAGLTTPAACAGRFVALDALDPVTSWTWSHDRAPDVIVGNPPFGGQLRRLTARSPGPRAAGTRGHGYADTASLFLRRSCHEVAPDGVVALVQPLSLLAARDAAAARDGVGEDLCSLWVPEGRLFDASVHVCAPVVRRRTGVRRDSREVPVRTGPDAEVVGEVPRDRLHRHRTWGPLWAEAAGVPPVELGPDVLGDRCRSGAGFRDEFYAVADLASDAPAGARDSGPGAGMSRVVTTGLLDWATTGWGRRPAVLGGTRYAAPTIDLDAVRVSPVRRLPGLLEARTAPKVLVATQTRVVEAVVDPEGGLWPAVPVVSVWLDDHGTGEPRDESGPMPPDGEVVTRLWLVAAALMAPPVTAWAVLESGGTARSAGALKLSARQVLRVPLPVDVDAWSEGAGLLRSASHDGDLVPEPEAVAEFGRVLTVAHGLDERVGAEVRRWWWERHPQGGSARNHR